MEAKLVALVRELSRRAGRPATDEEARAALAPLSAGQEQALLDYAQGEPPAKPLGPMAWADIAQGTPAQTAAARELTGYYSLLTERDALAQVLRAKSPGSSEKHPAPAAAPQAKAFSNATAWDDSDDAEIREETVENEDDGSGFDEPKPRQVKLEAARKIEPKPIPRDRKASALAGDDDQAARLLTLFAYHRDAPLVAKALGWSRAELDAEVDRLSLKRKTQKLIRGLDTEMPAATVRKGAKEAPVRRRSAKEKADEAAKAETVKQLAKLAALEAQKPAAPNVSDEHAPTRSRRLPGKSLKNDESARRASDAKAAKAAPAPEPLPEHKRERLPVKPSAEQGDELRAILREVGPRRHALAARLGSAGKPLSTATLLARFRAAGLEREFGQRERDLVRALVSRHRSALAPAAAELSISKRELEELIKERGLAREVEEQRERQRTSARAARWPKARVTLFLERRDWLQDLGVYAELEEDLRTRTSVIWTGLAGGTGKVDALAESLGIKLDEARALAKMLSLI